MRLVPLILLFITLPLHADDLGLKVPPGFRVTLWADHTLANDIFTMALDDKGRVVVSGPGYIRRLEDTNGDGKADKATDIAETKTGAMGLLFNFETEISPADFYAVADGRIRRFSAMHDPKRCSNMIRDSSILFLSRNMEGTPSKLVRMACLMQLPETKAESGN